MPKDKFRHYETIKANLLSEGKASQEAKRIAAAVSNKRGKPVPPSHPKKQKSSRS